MTAYVLYDNVFNHTGVTISYGSEVDNSGPFAHDMLLYDRWISGSTASSVSIIVDLPANYEVDTWAVFGHNIGTNGGGLVVYYYDLGWRVADQIATGTLTDDSPIFRRFTPRTSDRFRFQVSLPTVDDQIYHIAIGKALQLKPLNTGFRPPMFEQFAAKNSVNNHGVLLGRSVAKAARDLTIRQNAITTAELYSDFKPWLDHAVKWPFMFCWNYEEYPGDSVFCWLDNTAPEPVYSNLCHISIEMRVKAMLWKEVPAT